MDSSDDIETDSEHDELEGTVRVLTIAQDIHARVLQASSLILEFMDEDDDRAPSTKCHPAKRRVFHPLALKSGDSPRPEADHVNKEDFGHYKL